MIGKIVVGERSERMTISEEKFERFCMAGALTFKTIECSEERTADYEVTIADLPTTFEIKEFELNDDEEHALKQFQRTGAASWGKKVGDRIRHKIEPAKSQLSPDRSPHRDLKRPLGY